MARFFATFEFPNGSLIARKHDAMYHPLCIELESGEPAITMRWEMQKLGYELP